MMNKKRVPVRGCRVPLMWAAKHILFFLPFCVGDKMIRTVSYGELSPNPLFSPCVSTAELCHLRPKSGCHAETLEETATIPYLRTNSLFLFVYSRSQRRKRGLVTCITIMQCGRPVSVDCTIVTWEISLFQAHSFLGHSAFIRKILQGVQGWPDSDWHCTF